MPKTLKNFRLTHQACRVLKLLAVETNQSETASLEGMLLACGKEFERFYSMGYHEGLIEGDKQRALQNSCKLNPVLERLKALNANKNAQEGALVGVNK